MFKYFQNNHSYFLLCLFALLCTFPLAPLLVVCVLCGCYTQPFDLPFTVWIMSQGKRATWQQIHFQSSNNSTGSGYYQSLSMRVTLQCCNMMQHQKQQQQQVCLSLIAICNIIINGCLPFSEWHALWIDNKASNWVTWILNYSIFFRKWWIRESYWTFKIQNVSL